MDNLPKELPRHKIKGCLDDGDNPYLNGMYKGITIQRDADQLILNKWIERAENAGEVITDLAEDLSKSHMATWEATVRAEKAEATSKKLVKALANISSTLGHGGLVGSPIYEARKEFACYASEKLRLAGYKYYENCGADGHIDGWFTEAELKSLSYIEPKGDTK